MKMMSMVGDGVCLGGVITSRVAVVIVLFRGRCGRGVLARRGGGDAGGERSSVLGREDRDWSVGLAPHCQCNQRIHQKGVVVVVVWRKWRRWGR